MQIIKRSGQTATFDGNKIAFVISKAFGNVGQVLTDEQKESLVRVITEKVQKATEKTVENIQDIVEETLMEQGFYAVAKSFILYRQKRSELRTARIALVTATGDLTLDKCLERIQKDFLEPEYSLNVLSAKFVSISKPSSSVNDQLNSLIKAACELTTQTAPKFEMIAGRLLAHKFHRNLEIELSKLNLRGFYDKLIYLTEAGLYGAYILKSYSQDEIEQAYSFIVPDRDNLFTFAGLDLLVKRYVISSHKHVPLETPQEMFLGIALHLAMNETHNRMSWVQRFYNMLSKMEVTMATPTLANARKPFHQLSSCFIDTVPDSLDGIYRSIDNFAQVSKFGGGMGMYLGKVRAMGSAIRNFEGAAGGVVRWIRLINDTAVAVDQLGVRQGAVAVYLDMWHRDLPEFLQLRTNNGDDRMKAHDVFPAVCVPDFFWRQVQENIDGDWYLMCPYEIKKVKGYCLEDFFGHEWESKYLDCVHDSRIGKRQIAIKDIVRLIIKSAVETGTPFIFNRDIVNEANPNHHVGCIYSSNLCTEIAQNMRGIESISRSIKTEDGEIRVVTETKPGDFVVCNLASLSLGRIPVQDGEYLDSLVATAVRALDNVIDLNFYPTPYAEITNRQYRSIGLGMSGYHHMLAKHGIKWESEEHLNFADKVFERINMAAIRASSDIAAEKGSYKYFEGSDWQNGQYFIKRKYNSPQWEELRRTVQHQGMRNAYLLAIAPTSSTSIIAGTTAGIDPVMNRYFLEEKKGSMLPRVAPELSQQTWWLYKNAHNIDQSWSVRAAGVRQRHIDQAQSMNLYITNDFTMRQVLNLYLQAFECGVKTIYYVRSKALEVEECESCAS